VVVGMELRNRECLRIQIPQVWPLELHHCLKDMNDTMFPKQKPQVWCLGEDTWDGVRGTAGWEEEEKGRESQAFASRHS